MERKGKRASFTAKPRMGRTASYFLFLIAAKLLLLTGSIRNEVGDDFRLSNALNVLDSDHNFFTNATEKSEDGNVSNWLTTKIPKNRKSRYEEGTVRLVGGRGVHEGNVEIYHLGRWGAVCDDEWDIREVTVVCRQLGFGRAFEVADNSKFGLSRKRFWMDNIYCNGDERNITDCQFDGWGIHDCTQREGAGVVCYDPRLHEVTTPLLTSPSSPTPTNSTFPISNSILPSTSALTSNSIFPNSISPSNSMSPLTSSMTSPLLPTSDINITESLNGSEPEGTVMRDSTGPKISIRAAMTGPMHVRLMGGRTHEEGRVEVRFGDGTWGVVCGDGWGMLEANVVCRMLGLGYAQAPVQSNFFGGLHLGMLLSGVKCEGRESSLADCLHDQIGWAYCPGRAENIAGVMCTEVVPDLVLDYGEIEKSAYLEDRQLFYLQCAMEENCLAKTAYPRNREVYGWQLEVRRLLRFTARSHNIGTTDFRPIIPKYLWQWHLCHMHYHSMEVFAHFDIMDVRGTRVAEGHKASFCLEDNQCDPGIQPKYACANYGDQGISVGCTDTYLHNVDCQWIDITDVNPGYYFLKISINPEFKIPEMSYDNNAALCSLYYNGLSVHVWNCTLMRP